jgi:4-hydroxybenzoate polyprenyltransferase
MHKLRIVLQMIRFEHTVFALPFSFLGAFLAARGFPGWVTSFWILTAMVGARSAAMAFNRLADHRFDSLNPRTASRPLPSGKLNRGFVGLFTIASVILFIGSAFALNRLAFVLSPLALAVVLGYSFAKRFTTFSHILLGLALAIAPVGGWVAVSGTLDWRPFVIAAAVLFWVAGFDIFYSCQDVEFDRKIGLFSIPSRFGIGHSLKIAAGFHILMVILLLLAFFLFELSWLSAIGILLVSCGLLYEHSLVRANDLSRINIAFFSMNGVISLVLFVFVGLDLCLLA